MIRFVNPPAKTDRSPEFTWTSSEQATFECSLDRGPYENCDSGTSGTWSKDVREGSHTLMVRGRDIVGNVGRIIAHTWTVGKKRVYNTGIKILRINSLIDRAPI